jgi:hypothetical protein
LILDGRNVGFEGPEIVQLLISGLVLILNGCNVGLESLDVGHSLDDVVDGGGHSRKSLGVVLSNSMLK